MSFPKLILDREAENHFRSPASMANIITNQIQSGFYSDMETYIRDNVVLDCGANIGLFSFYCSHIAKKVISVEPTKSHSAILRNLISLNDFKNICVEESALSNKNQTIYFYENKNNTTMNSLFPYGNDGSVKYEVQAKTLKSILAEHEIPDKFFLKIDIEGSETLLFDDSDFFESLNKCGAFFLEVHDLDTMNHDVMKKIQNDWINKIKNSCNNINTIKSIGVDGIFGCRAIIQE
jgi:FkbM family methyltransferase